MAWIRGICPLQQVYHLVVFDFSRQRSENLKITQINIKRSEELP